jgi:hypothetical protein
MENNFVLPETEKTLNLIIAKIKRFFEISALSFSGFYALYTVFRIFLMPQYLVLNIILCIVSWGIFILTALEFFKKEKESRKVKPESEPVSENEKIVSQSQTLSYENSAKVKRILNIVFEVLKRLVWILIFILTFVSLFSSYNELLPYKVLFTMFCGVGIILSAAGDIFNATFPAWTQMVLNSFKSDIEISGLAERSMKQLKEEFKKDEFKEKLATGALQEGTSLVRNVFGNLFKHRDNHANE